MPNQKLTLLSFWPLGSAAVVLMVYKSMQEVLNASFFNAGPSKTAKMMSNVISVILPDTLNKALLIPVNLTMQNVLVGFHFI